MSNTWVAHGPPPAWHPVGQNLDKVWIQIKLIQILTLSKLCATPERPMAHRPPGALTRKLIQKLSPSGACPDPVQHSLSERIWDEASESRRSHLSHWYPGQQQSASWPWGNSRATWAPSQMPGCPWRWEMPELAGFDGTKGIPTTRILQIHGGGRMWVDHGGLWGPPGCRHICRWGPEEVECQRGHTGHTVWLMALHPLGACLVPAQTLISGRRRSMGPLESSSAGSRCQLAGGQGNCHLLEKKFWLQPDNRLTPSLPG